MFTPAAVGFLFACEPFGGAYEGRISAFRASGATAVVSLGGGSTTGLGKAIAVRTGADQVVIPTTYAGSEMTDILGETAAGEKTTRRSPDIRPETVIYDVDLTMSLPIGLTVTSAMNAIAQCSFDAVTLLNFRL
jgi:maleylacetate reductase